mmetsp:Transcript_20009/g.51115  ORF Transcript_20009/g.51115 Transcript_20009/m.51115 type:complete len:329 (-) Transcript_20009:630-1616(-)
MMSELLIWCTMRPENAQAFGSLGPASGCTASAKVVHRQYEASSAFSRDAKPLLAPSTAATAAPPSCCSPPPPFAGASLSTARWLAPLRASKRRSCARSTTSRSPGGAMPAFAFFLAKPLPRLPIDSAIASRASSASATPPPVRASTRLSRVASAVPANTLWLASAAPAPFFFAPPSPSSASRMGGAPEGPVGGAMRCSRCSAARTTKPKIRGQASAPGPSSAGAPPLLGGSCNSARPFFRAPPKALVKASMVSFTIPASVFSMVTRTSGSRKAASATIKAPCTSSGAAWRRPRRAAAAWSRSQAASMEAPRRFQRTAVRIKAESCTSV